MQLQQSDWRRGVRWFAAEFLVVVSGVLVALALQAWYQARQNAHAEQVYIKQLDSDLDASQRALRLAISEDNQRIEGNAKLLSAIYSSQPLTADSAKAWVRLQLGYYSDPRPVMGTVSTLIETGDIKLIRDAALRSHIVAYASLMESDLQELGRNITRLTNANDAERRQEERNNIKPIIGVRFTSASLLAGSYSDEEVATFLPRYLAIWPVVRADADLRAAYQQRLRSFANRVFYLERMLTSTNELRAVLKSKRPNTNTR